MTQPIKQPIHLASVQIQRKHPWDYVLDCCGMRNIKDPKDKRLLVNIIYILVFVHPSSHTTPSQAATTTTSVYDRKLYPCYWNTYPIEIHWTEANLRTQ